MDAAQKESTKKYSVESLHNFMYDELRNGFHGLEGKLYPGVVGEMGCSWPITDFERRHLTAAGQLHEIEGIFQQLICLRFNNLDSPPEIFKFSYSSEIYGESL